MERELARGLGEVDVDQPRVTANMQCAECSAWSACCEFNWHVAWRSLTSITAHLMNAAPNIQHHFCTAKATFTDKCDWWSEQPRKTKARQYMVSLRRVGIYVCRGLCSWGRSTTNQLWVMFTCNQTYASNIFPDAIHSCLLRLNALVMVFCHF